MLVSSNIIPSYCFRNISKNTFKVNVMLLLTIIKTSHSPVWTQHSQPNLYDERMKKLYAAQFGWLEKLNKQYNSMMSTHEEWVKDEFETKLHSYFNFFELLMEYDDNIFRNAEYKKCIVFQKVRKDFKGKNADFFEYFIQVQLLYFTKDEDAKKERIKCKKWAFGDYFCYNYVFSLADRETKEFGMLKENDGHLQSNINDFFIDDHFKKEFENVKFEGNSILCYCIKKGLSFKEIWNYQVKQYHVFGGNDNENYGMYFFRKSENTSILGMVITFVNSNL